MQIKRIHFLFIVLFILGFSLNSQAQDYLSVPSSRPELFPEWYKLSEEKTFYQKDSVIYEFDTLELPFIDDFSINHFPPLIKDPANDSLVSDTVLIALFELNGQLYTGGDSLVRDSTFTYSLTTNGDTLSSMKNNFTLYRYYDISSYPAELQIIEAYPAYNIFDTVGGGVDTAFIQANIYQDSIRYYLVEKDTNAFYQDRKVHHNFTQGFYPPSLGVVTFDGLNEYGLPYNFEDISVNGRADELTSVPIDLSNTSDSTYFSFYYQAKGFAIDSPNPEDSLSLEFYNSDSERWGLVWQREGIGEAAQVDSFKQVIIRVDSQFRTAGFQFRFRNRARLSGAFDPWHVDYIYLDDNRRANDTIPKDIAYVYPAPSLLSPYEAMPVWHFKTNPANYMADVVSLTVRNNFGDPLNVFNKIVIPDTNANPPSNFYIFPGSTQFLQILPFGNLALNYPINFDYPPSAVDSTGVFKGICDIDFRPAPIETKDFIRSNDTTYSRAVLSNYYAYDDGSAEAGYGINTGSQGGSTSYLAVRFDMPFQDTIGGVKMYFLPQDNDIRNQRFQLTIWSSLSPPNIIFQKEVNSRAIYDEQDYYITYFFDSLVLAGPTFYVGYQKSGELSMNLGYDLNKNHRDKIFWSLDGNNWSNPSTGIRDGSVMIRPVLRKKFYGVGISEKELSKSSGLKVFPNPSEGSFYIDPEFLDQGIRSLSLFDLNGRLVKEISVGRGMIYLDGVENGMYLLRAIDKQNRPYTEKLIIRR